MFNISGILNLRRIFPELTDAEFMVLMHYAQGTSVDCTADIMKLSVAAIKQTLQRTRNKLMLEKLESARGLYNARIHTALVSAESLSSSRHEAMPKYSFNKNSENRAN
ncbi:sigma factor-like helix-turn-helix DNA-binding protein [Scandinavium lactucae]|uniref:Sigma factor-like helix-turn-helix DNA-binding protein n=1 Tax=Scandinavium lactucae TaxID=3095028 RepID=A0ABU4QVI3_9ENTR|nr:MULTISPECIES: sigma factor-like helix-turn-helix DNA-binding protein [unclassified Scandinavium]MDX6041280.1 sigma factor-like helix-turn-helix DNA-binding protein [Scandinavium sp. V105_6]MDX6049798.1 sigma factor-like helix-turn-helix DNA-binding protein [Scandinavium sp. V105_1]